MMHGWYGWNGMGMLGGGLMMLFWPLLIGLVVYFLVKSNNGNHRGQHSSALDLLDEKYAAGEIPEEEYLHKKKMLKK